MENSDDRKTGTVRGCAGSTNTGGTRKLYNTLKGIRNPITWNLDNPRKGIWKLVPDGIRSQCPRRLTVQT